MPQLPRRFDCLALLALGLASTAFAASSATPLVPARHGSFGHYTFALTWQPGFCSVYRGCLPGQPHTVLVGLHGLWASRPQSLLARHIRAPQWWRHGCDYYHHSDRPPALPPALLQRLHQVMPHLRRSLLVHEYDKHVQCFGFDPRSFFTTELRMRRAVIDSSFGHYLINVARGHEVARRHVLHTFMHAFGTDQRSALQLRCARDHRGQVVLTQLWITLHTDALRRFPRDGALMNAPIAQHNCPARFRVPNWT